jgi:hypothetical protein
MQTTFQDDLETVNVSRLRASGAITADATRVVAASDGETNAHPRELRVLHREFPCSEDWRFVVATYCEAARQAGDSAKRAILRHAARCCAR